MKPAPFEYYRATSTAEAVSLLASHGPDAKILAGGQSLLPLMKLRLARPRVIVDLNRASALAYVRRTDGMLACGALARLAELESPTVQSLCPILTVVARQIGHPTIRHRGTICGSLAHADPVAELPVLAMALEADMLVAGPAGERLVPARDFFVTYFTTSMSPAEILVEARFPLPRPNGGWGFAELARRQGDFAIATAAAVLEVGPSGAISAARIALGAVADRPIRCQEAEAVLVGRPGGTAAFDAAAEAAVADVEPPSDVHGSSAYRRHAARVLVERVLNEAWQRASASNGNVMPKR